MVNSTGETSPRRGAPRVVTLDELVKGVAKLKGQVQRLGAVARLAARDSERSRIGQCEDGVVGMVGNG